MLHSLKMASELELSKQTVPISKLDKHSSSGVIKVLVIRRGALRSYGKPGQQGVYRTFILVDNEGTKIQTTLFNNLIEKWKDCLEPNRTYYIINGRVDPVNPNYSSVHPEFEISFTNNTIIKESSKDISIDKISNGFVSLEEAQLFDDDTIFDAVCLLAAVKPLCGEGSRTRREIIVMNQRYDHAPVTLWGEFAENEGEVLHTLKDDKPILGLCDVKVSFYRGNFGIKTTPVSTIMINPQIRKALALRNWRDSMEADNKELELMPTKAIRKTKDVELGDIVDGFLEETHESYFRFTGKIVELLNKDEPWYSCCEKCFKRVDILDNTASCPNCKLQNVEYKSRYCVRVEISSGNSRAPAVLFDAAADLLGCNIADYIQSTAEKKEESKYYRKLVLSIDKDFCFLVRIDRRKTNSGSLIVEEIHAVEDADAVEVVGDVKFAKRERKRTKKYNDVARPITEIHDVEDVTAIEVVGDEKLPKRARKSTKKYNDTERPTTVKKIKVEKD